MTPGIEGLAAARREREEREAAQAKRKARLDRRVAIIRAAILYPLLIAALWLIWLFGVLYGRAVVK